MKERKRLLTDDQISDLADDLRGTAQSLNDALRGIDIADGGITSCDLTVEDYKALDAIVLECECCGWWWDAFEINNDLCPDCKEESNED